MNSPKSEILQKALAREKLARKEAEKILEEKSLELFNKSKELLAINENLAKVIDQKTIEFKGIFDNIIDSYILMDLYGNVLKMNKPAVNFFGFDIKNEQFNVSEILYEDDFEYAQKSFKKLLIEGSFKNYQSRIYTKSKEVKWVQINSSIVTDTTGIPAFAHGIIRDITKAKQQQQDFEEQKQQLDAIVDNSFLGIVLSNKEGKVLKTNTALENLLNYPQEELLNLKVDDITLKEDNDVFHKYINDLNNGKTDHFTLKRRYQSKKGEIIWGKTNVAAVRKTNKSLHYQVFLIEDITEELKKGALLEALNNLMSSILGKTNIYEISLEIAEKIIGLLDFENCVIYLLDKEKQVLQQIASYGKSSNKIVPLGEGVISTVAETGIPEIISDVSKDPRYLMDTELNIRKLLYPLFQVKKLSE
ncbi:MAG: PAS domain S-box protein [Flavobacteriaceae bacterium]|nr:MAG: PAS domain S-box protein [Flavobacteriaceae bacterium]